jgi:hypothetical protein
MTQVVSGQQLAAVVRAQTHTNPYGICAEQSSTGTGFLPSTLALPCQHHSIIAPYALIHSPLTLYKLTN